MFIYIPPAYNNVKINLSKNGKVLAIGMILKIDLNIFIMKNLKKNKVIKNLIICMILV